MISQLALQGLPQRAIAEGATTPNPGAAGVWAWSTTLTKPVVWNGTAWVSLPVGTYPWTEIVKSADQTKTANTTLATDSELSFTMAISAKYRVEMEVYFDSTAAGDFKWRHVGPTSPSIVRLSRRAIVPGAAVAFSSILVDLAFSAADLPLVSTGTTGGVIYLEGIVHNGANAGTFGFQWAQNTSDAGNTIVRAGSILRYRTV